jgi:hypothetical protein
LSKAERFEQGSEVTMSGYQGVLDNPVKIMMLLLCILGAGFMTWFLVGLIADQRRENARYVVRFNLGENHSVKALPAQSDDEASLNKTQIDTLPIDRESHLPIHGFRMKQYF